jgi:hypothetical protein
MNTTGKGPSRRFRSTAWTERLVPVLLVLLLVVLVGTILFVLLSSLGILPSL